MTDVAREEMEALVAAVRKALPEIAQEWVTENGVRYVATENPRANERAKSADAALDRLRSLLLRAEQERDRLAASARYECDHLGGSEGLLNTLASLASPEKTKKAGPAHD